MAGSGDCAGGSTVGVELALGAARMRRRPTRAARGEGRRVDLLNGGRGRGNARGGGRCPRPRVRLCGRCGVRRRCSAEHGGGRGGCGRHETEPAARAGRAARGQGAPVWAVRHPLGAEDGGMETKLGGGLVWCCDSCVPRLGRPWQWCRLAAANVCSGVSELRAKALTRSFLVEWRRRLRASLSLLRASFWSKNPVAQVSG